MAEKSRSETVAEKVFDNLIFIAEVFADREEEEIPDVPLLELARSFELRHFGARKAIAKAVNHNALDPRKRVIRPSWPP
jgi:hypothetical protein